MEGWGGVGMGWGGVVAVMRTGIRGAAGDTGGARRSTPLIQNTPGQGRTGLGQTERERDRQTDRQTEREKEQKR